MKKLVLVMGLLMSSLLIVQPVQAAGPYNFGDYRSETLATKAWGALNEGDIEGVLAYSSKCLELYAEQAKTMQSKLTDYPAGKNEDVFSYWALNDVATILFVQAEAYRKANMMEEAKEAYKKIVNEFSYGQCWDPKGWFWKPAEAAKEKLAMIESGVDIDFGDYTSSTIVQKAWKALADNDLDAVIVYTSKVLELYAPKAKEMQESLTEYPWENKDKIFSYWALNDVGTALFILGEAYRNAGKKDQASEAFKKLIDEYSYSQCWDPHGWFWKPSEAAQEKLAMIESE